MQTLTDIKQEKIDLCRVAYNATALVVNLQIAAVDCNTGQLVEGEFWLTEKDTELLELFNNLGARLLGERLMQQKPFKARRK